jgi:hypothetical protein
MDSDANTVFHNNNTSQKSEGETKQYVSQDGNPVTLSMLGNFQPVKPSEKCHKIIDAELSEIPSNISSNLFNKKGCTYADVYVYKKKFL